MDNCTTHMWLASRAKPLKQLPSVRAASVARPTSLRAMSNFAGTLATTPDESHRFQFHKSQILSNVFLKFSFKTAFLRHVQVCPDEGLEECQGSDCFVLQWLPLVLLETTVIGVCCCCWCYNTGEFTTTVHLHSNCCSREWTAAA